MQRTLFALAMLLLFLAGVVLLQIFLSRRESRWPGLVLPLISFLYALVLVLNAAYFVSMAHAVLTTVLVFVIGNIPTAVLLAIYAACREKRKKQKKQSELERMRIEDL